MTESRHMTAAEFREHGRAVVDWIADYWERVDSLPVLSPVAPGDVRSLLPESPPERGEAFEEVLADVESLILPGVTHWQSPSFFAYFPCQQLRHRRSSASLLSAGLGVQGMLWATSPACTELETHVLDWLVEMLDLPERIPVHSGCRRRGVIQDTASSATLCALLAARERATDFSAPISRAAARKAGRLRLEPGPLFDREGGAMIAGIGPRATCG